MNIWNEMDRGGLKQDEGLQQADEAIRKRAAEQDQ